MAMVVKYANLAQKSCYKTNVLNSLLKAGANFVLKACNWQKSHVLKKKKDAKIEVHFFYKLKLTNLGYLL